MSSTNLEKAYIRNLNKTLPDGALRCFSCGLFKKESAFSPAARWKGSKRKSSYECRTCNSERSREYRNRQSPEKLKASQRRSQLKGKYGLTEDQWSDLLVSQNGVCAICDGDAPGNVDHDHETGRVRGLLCTGCNLGLGHFKDNIVSLEAAIVYLRGEPS